MITKPVFASTSAWRARPGKSTLTSQSTSKQFLCHRIVVESLGVPLLMLWAPWTEIFLRVVGFPKSITCYGFAFRHHSSIFIVSAAPGIVLDPKQQLCLKLFYCSVSLSTPLTQAFAWRPPHLSGQDQQTNSTAIEHFETVEYIPPTCDLLNQELEISRIFKRYNPLFSRKLQLLEVTHPWKILTQTRSGDSLIKQPS